MNEYVIRLLPTDRCSPRVLRGKPNNNAHWFTRATQPVAYSSLVSSLPPSPPKGYLLDCPLSVAEGLKTHLKLYKLRSKVRIKDVTALYDVLVSGVRDPWQQAAEGGGAAADPSAPPAAAGGRAARFADPRCAALGVRVIRPKEEAGVCRVALFCCLFSSAVQLLERVGPGPCFCCCCCCLFSRALPLSASIVGRLGSAAMCRARCSRVER